MTPPPKLEQGQPDDEYPLNEQGSESFNVGGVRRTLPPIEQLEQLVSYLDASYPRPDFRPPWINPEADSAAADRYVALLPDRITHASLLMLGTAVDHTMPGVAFAAGVTTSEVPGLPAQVITPAEPTGAWAVTFHSGGWWRGAGTALDHQWRPEVAAAAALSGTTMIDVDYPLAPQATLTDIIDVADQVIQHARSAGATSVTAWGYSSGAALAALLADRVDALVLTFPDLLSVDKLPAEIRGDVAVPAPAQWPPTLVQLATHDEVVTEQPDIGAAEVAHYVSQHQISTPEVARNRIEDTAGYLRKV